VTDSFAFLSGLITGFFSAFKGGYEIRRKMLMISAIAEGTCKNWRRTVHLSISAKDEQVIILSLTSISGRFLSNTGEFAKRIELNKTLTTHSSPLQFVVDYLPDRWEIQKMGRIDVYIQAETSMNFRCYFSLQEFQNSSFVQAKTGFQESEQKKELPIKVSLLKHRQNKELT
jgi:hypothetical protein